MDVHWAIAVTQSRGSWSKPDCISWALLSSWGRSLTAIPRLRSKALHLPPVNFQNQYFMAFISLYFTNAGWHYPEKMFLWCEETQSNVVRGETYWKRGEIPEEKKGPGQYESLTSTRAPTSLCYHDSQCNLLCIQIHFPPCFYIYVIYSISFLAYV